MTTTPTDHGADPTAAVDPDDSAEVASLKIELWHARQAAVDAVAETGRMRARNRELEALIHQLRTELDRFAHVEDSLSYRVGNTIAAPVRAVRRRLR